MPNGILHPLEVPPLERPTGAFHHRQSRHLSCPRHHVMRRQLPPNPPPASMNRSDMLRARHLADTLIGADCIACIRRGGGSHGTSLMSETERHSQGRWRTVGPWEESTADSPDLCSAICHRDVGCRGAATLQTPSLSSSSTGRRFQSDVGGWATPRKRTAHRSPESGKKEGMSDIEGGGGGAVKG